MSEAADPGGRDLLELLRLDHRTAVVVGGSGHIGRAICDSLAELGAAVAVVDRYERAASDVADALVATRGTTASGHGIDLENADYGRLLEDVLAVHGGVGIVVHAAALVGTSGLPGWTTPFEEQSVVTWRRALEVNLTSVFGLVQAFTPELRRSGHGSVITVGSIYGEVGVDLRMYGNTGMGSPAAYAASKGGLVQLTRWMSTVLAPEIRVNAVSPGGVARGQAEEFVREYTDRVPLRRLAVEQDVKGPIAFLATDAAAYITGQNVMVDGGWTAW